ncbi:hypothetical protein BGZ50_008798 [Haplosporangium sp. Z 11]|nr:hypothetical protein BGZ50_008798 [Haplosporangium sp. Z 11]
MALPLEKINYHAEYHSNINSITLSVQVPPSGLTCRIGPEAIDLIPSNHAPQQGLDATTTSITAQEKTVRYAPPVMVMPTRTTLDPCSSQSSQLTLKLTALPNAYSSSPSSASALRTPSGSEFPPAPLPAAQLQGLQNLMCGCCRSTLLKYDSNGINDNDNECDNGTGRGPIQRVVDLPSEHWQELVDCWMCHEEDFTELREGDLGARVGQALVGGTYILIHAADVDHDAVVIEEDARVIDWTKGIKRRWRPLACSRCLYPIGDGWYQSRREDGTDLELIQVKFLKYMVGFKGENKQRRQPLNIPRQRFTSYVAAEIFESARHHATYRFILQDRFQGRDMMLLWMLNWDTMINTNQEPAQDSFMQWDQSLESDLKPTNNSAGAGKSSVQGNKKVMKVLYLQAPPPPKGPGQQQGEEIYSKEMQLWDRWRSDPGVERLEFQERLILGLMTLLEQSTSCLPPNLNGPASMVLAMEGMCVGSFEI